MAFCAIFTLTHHFHPHFQISRFHRAIKFPQYLHSQRRIATTTIMSSASGIAGTAAGETKLTAPYGSWKSPITADVVSGSDKRLGGFSADSLGRLHWLESRPTESGRTVLVRQGENEKDEPHDITPKDFTVRTVVQEYGGGAFSIVGDSVVFSNYKDQRLYKQSISSNDSAPVPLTPDYSGPHVCYADGVFDSRFNRYLTVREDRRESSTNPTTTIVSIDLCGDHVKEPKTLVGGNDFYAFPRIDHKGERVAWIEWGHPNMPWDKSELWVGYLSEKGEIKNRICVAGGDPSIVESPTEPKWSPEGELFFITDRKSGFWNIYRWVESTNEVLPVYSINAEFTKPLWVFGVNSYDFLQIPDRKNLIACNYRMKGRSHLGILDVTQSKISPLDIPFTDINNIISGPDCLYVEGASAVHPLSIAKVVISTLMILQIKLSTLQSRGGISKRLGQRFLVELGVVPSISKSIVLYWINGGAIAEERCQGNTTDPNPYMYLGCYTHCTSL